MAGRANDAAHVFFKLQLPRTRSSLLVARHEIGNDAVPFLGVPPDEAPPRSPLADHWLLDAVEQPVFLQLGHLLPGLLEVDVLGVTNSFEDVLAPPPHVC